ncbi:MAG: CHAT domain-containing protein [Alphaproteobacteria bacterium]|nr:CHAT domain-containing protein [Alphaproteobacteria bacterium]
MPVLAGFASGGPSVVRLKLEFDDNQDLLLKFGSDHLKMRGNWLRDHWSSLLRLTQPGGGRTTEDREITKAFGIEFWSRREGCRRLASRLISAKVLAFYPDEELLVQSEELPLGRIPWEHLPNSNGKEQLRASSQIVREVYAPRLRQALPMAPTKRGREPSSPQGAPASVSGENAPKACTAGILLFVWADLAGNAVPYEKHREVLQAAASAAGLHYVELDNARYKDIKQFLESNDRTQPIIAFHVLAHARRKDGEFGLCLKPGSNSNDDVDLVTPDRFSMLVSMARYNPQNQIESRLDIVSVAACNQAAGDDTLSLLEAAASTGAAPVVGFSRRVKKRASVDITEAIYRIYTRKKTLLEAFNDAMNAAACADESGAKEHRTGLTLVCPRPHGAVLPAHRAMTQNRLAVFAENSTLSSQHARLVSDLAQEYAVPLDRGLLLERYSSNPRVVDEWAHDWAYEVMLEAMEQGRDGELVDHIRGHRLGAVGNHRVHGRVKTYHVLGGAVLLMILLFWVDKALAAQPGWTTSVRHTLFVLLEVINPLGYLLIVDVPRTLHRPLARRVHVLNLAFLLMAPLSLLLGPSPPSLPTTEPHSTQTPSTLDASDAEVGPELEEQPDEEEVLATDARSDDSEPPASGLPDDSGDTPREPTTPPPTPPPSSPPKQTKTDTKKSEEWTPEERDPTFKLKLRSGD